MPLATPVGSYTSARKPAHDEVRVPSRLDAVATLVYSPLRCDIHSGDMVWRADGACAAPLVLTV
jgi:hypothetical protein